MQLLLAAALLAGVARVDVTPPNGIQLAGYSATNRPADGVLDPLYAQALVLDDGKSKAAIVTLDLIFTPPDAEMRAVRARAKASANVADVIFLASHTHSGPLFFDQKAWLATLVDKIGSAIEQADRNRKPARIGAAWGQTQIGFNRRYVPPEGAAVMHWRNATKTATFPVDPTVGVLRIDSEDATPIAILVNYACHPVVFGPDNRKYSADFPGEMRKTIERAIPGALAFYLQGGAGDINPYHDKTPLPENGVERMRAIGRQLGEEVVRVASTIRPQPSEPSVAMRVTEHEFAYRYDQNKTEELIAKTGRAPIARYPLWGDPLKLPVTALLINKQYAFVGMPAEPFVEFQMYLRAHSPLPFTYFLGYANGNVNYIPTINAAVRGGYGADNMITRIEVGAGEEMIHRGLVSLYTLLGKFGEKK